MQTLILATGNSHKVSEAQSLLGDAYRVKSLKDFPAPPAIEETGETFAENAKLKALGIARWLSEIGREMETAIGVLADDSGLEVRTLAWAPGIYSARFAALDGTRKGNSSDEDNNAKLLRLMRDTPMDLRQARFRCCLAFAPTALARPICDAATVATHEGVIFFQGACEGRIGLGASGNRGFGYDPLFIPEGRAVSFAELGEDVKNQISHRSRAMEQFKAFLVNRRAAPSEA